ncbi:MAG: hypothetical protein RRZ66_12615, partial [Bacteroidales bacterium]
QWLNDDKGCSIICSLSSLMGANIQKGMRALPSLGIELAKRDKDTKYQIRLLCPNFLLIYK